MNSMAWAAVSLSSPPHLHVDRVRCSAAALALAERPVCGRMRVRLPACMGVGMWACTLTFHKLVVVPAEPHIRNNLPLRSLQHVVMCIAMYVMIHVVIHAAMHVMSLHIIIHVVLHVVIPVALRVGIHVPLHVVVHVVIHLAVHVVIPGCAHPHRCHYRLSPCVPIHMHVIMTWCICHTCAPKSSRSRIARHLLTCKLSYSCCHTRCHTRPHGCCHSCRHAYHPSCPCTDCRTPAARVCVRAFILVPSNSYASKCML